jgi:hypothetical protein
VNGYDDFVRAGALAARMSGIDALELLAARAIRPDKALIARIAGQAAPVVALVRSGLRKPCAVPARRTYEAAVSAPGWPMGTLARVLVTTAEHQAEAGRPGEAVRVLLDALDAVERCRQGGGIRDSLACDAAARLPAAALERVLPRLSAGDLEAVSARLARIAAARTPPNATLEAEKRIVPVMQARLSRAALGPALWIGRCLPSMDPWDDVHRQ